MKKLMLCLLAVTFAMSLSVFAERDNNMAQTQADQAGAQAPLMTLRGTVKAEGVGSSHIGPRLDQVRTRDNSQPGLLGDQDRLSVVRRHGPATALGQGKTHRLAIRPEQRGVMNVPGLLLRVVGLARSEHPRTQERREIHGHVPVRSGVVRIVLPHVLDLGLDGTWEAPAMARGPKDRLGLPRGEEVDQATGVDHRWLG